MRFSFRFRLYAFKKGGCSFIRGENYYLRNTTIGIRDKTKLANTNRETRSANRLKKRDS